jgi:hypothetical protein
LRADVGRFLCDASIQDFYEPVTQLAASGAGRRETP